MKAYSGSPDPSPTVEHVEMSTITIGYPAFEKSRTDLGGNVGGKPSMSMAGKAVSLPDEWLSILLIVIVDEDVGAGWQMDGGARGKVDGYCSGLSLGLGQKGCEMIRCQG